MIFAPGTKLLLSGTAVTVITDVLLIICEVLLCHWIFKRINKKRAMLTAVTASIITSLLSFYPSNNAGFALGVLPHLYFIPLIILFRAAIYLKGFNLTLSRSVPTSILVSVLLWTIGVFVWGLLLGLTTVQDPNYVPVDVTDVNF
jgi:hypothetical protein